MLKIKLFLLITSILLLSLGFNPTYAQENVQNLKPSRISGEVIRVDDHRLVLQTKEGLKEITVPNGVKIENRVLPFMEKEKISQFTPGEEIILTLNENGEVVLVQYLPKLLSDAFKWAIPVFMIILIGLLLSKLLKHKNRRDFIKTSATSVA